MKNRNMAPVDLSPARHAGRRTARRLVVRGVAAASLVALMTGLPSVAVRAADPIKIGILLPLSGNFAENGQQTLTGLKMYFDKVGNKAGGHSLDLLVEDTQGKPQGNRI